MTLFIVLSSIFVYFLLGAIAMGVTQELWDWKFESWADGPEKLGWFLFWPLVFLFLGIAAMSDWLTSLTCSLIRRVRGR